MPNQHDVIRHKNHRPNQSKQIGWYMNEITTQPDSKFGGRVGKLILLQYLETYILMDDDFFNESPFHQIEYQARWQDYLDDCVVYACLHSYMHGIEVPTMTNEPVWVKIEMIIKTLGMPGIVNNTQDFGGGINQNII